MNNGDRAMEKGIIIIVFITIVIFAAIHPLLGCCQQCSDCGSQCGDCECASNPDGDGDDPGEDGSFYQAQNYQPQSTPVCNPVQEQPNGFDDDCDGVPDEEDCGDHPFPIDNNGNGQTDESPPC